MYNNCYYDDELFLTTTKRKDWSFSHFSSEKHNIKEEEEPNLFHGLCDNKDVEIVDCLLNLPSLQQMNNPITMVNLRNHQQADEALLEHERRYPAFYRRKLIGESEIICAVLPNVGENEWKIFLPNSLVHDAIRWYHLVLGHPGSTRLYDTMKTRFHHPRLSSLCMAYRCPDNCSMHKNSGAGYGHLAPRHAELMPWHDVAVDLIGPWKITINGTDLVFQALTAMDPVTNLLEIARIDKKTSANVAQTFSNVWLARYPWAYRCIHDNGGEFIGHEFQQLLAEVGIVSKPTTVKNPQSNGLVERSHKTIADTLRVLLHVSPPTNMDDATRMVDNALASCMHAMRCSVNHTMQTSPGAMVFNRDMLIEVPLIANKYAIRGRRQQMIDERLRRANRMRIDHSYQVGDRVMIVHYDPRKLDSKQHGPYPIVRVHTNGTVRVQLREHVQETFSIRKIFPYRGTY